jgi:hypothetical protein
MPGCGDVLTFLPLPSPPFTPLQCFVGRNFGSFVTVLENHYIYFYIGQMGFVVFAAQTK